MYRFSICLEFSFAKFFFAIVCGLARSSTNVTNYIHKPLYIELCAAGAAAAATVFPIDAYAKCGRGVDVPHNTRTHTSCGKYYNSNHFSSFICLFSFSPASFFLRFSHLEIQAQR